MRFLIFIAFLFFTWWSHGQAWRDSILSARQAYFSKQYVKALHSYDYAEKVLSSKTDLSAEKAQSAFRKGDYNAAVYHYKKGLKKGMYSSENAQSYYNIGNAFLKQKKYKEAIKSYKNALKIDPFNDQTRYNLSQALRKLNQSKKKQKPKEQPKKKDPKKDNKDKKKQDQSKNNGTKPKEQKQDQQPTDQSQGNKQRKNAADRILNKLLKDEAATKRKLNNARMKRNGKQQPSEFDW